MSEIRPSWPAEATDRWVRADGLNTRHSDEDEEEDEGQEPDEQDEDEDEDDEEDSEDESDGYSE